MEHEWEDLYIVDEWNNATEDSVIDRCKCGALRVEMGDGTYAYFRAAWASPEEPECNVER